MIPRTIREKVVYFSQKYPVVTLTGPRQSGKTTLLRNAFPGYAYVSLEEPDIRLFAINDPRMFLKNYSDKTIIDEIQHAPDLFSYIQTRVDIENKPGMYILSGSQNFLLLERISQSLAGRTAILHLFPFCFSEIKDHGYLSADQDEVIFKGFFPGLISRELTPEEFFPYYIQTYLERDVRFLRNIGDYNLFVKFLILCAGRTGQILNLSSMANECGISQPTANAWISILEAGFVVFRLQPYFRNYNKRIIKSPKLYFYDTGLLCSLLSIQNKGQVAHYYNRGALFENLIIADLMKQFHHKGIRPEFYFWRDSTGNEIDLLLERGGKLLNIEIKPGATYKPEYARNLVLWKKVTGTDSARSLIIYGGDKAYETSEGKLIPWNKADDEVLPYFGL